MNLLRSFFKKKSILFISVLSLLTFTIIWAISYSIKDDNEYAVNQSALDNGENLFIKNCVSCHALKEDGIGPPLGGITSVLSKEELISFVQNPSSVIASGNKRANYLSDKYNNVMPSFEYLNPKKLTNIFGYIKNESEKNNIAAYPINWKDTKEKNQRYAEPITFNGLVIELEEYIKIPLDPDRGRKKGIATLRTTPALENTIFVSDQMGKLYISQNKETSLFLDLASKFGDFISEPGNGTGLGSFAIHPDYKKNGLFYTTHAETYLKKEAINKISIPDSVGVWLQWVLTEWKVKDLKALVFNGSKREVLRVDPLTHAHGVQDIGFNPYLSKNHPDYGMLYMGIGDGGANNRGYSKLANTKYTPLGSILRIDPLGTNSSNGQYGIPKSNPFFNDKDTLVQKEIFANGFRNPHRFCWHRNTGAMLAADIGEANVEELNIVKSGKNYGWSALEGTYGIDMKKDAKTLFAATPKQLSDFELPFAAYDHNDGNAISGGYIYEGNIEALKGKYIFGDISRGRLFYIDIDNDFQNNKIHELKIYDNNLETTLKKIVGERRTNLRIGYDVNNKELFIMTKEDGAVRRVVDAYYITKNHFK